MSTVNTSATRALDTFTRPHQLPFPELPAAGFRVSQAEFARIMQVSRQAVGQWIADGKIGMGSDGLIDPGQAVAELVRSKYTRRIGSKLLKPLVDQIADMHHENCQLKREVEALRKRLGDPPRDSRLPQVSAWQSNGGAG